MATLRNRRKLAAIKRENYEEHPKKSQERETNVATIGEDDNTKVSKEIEVRVTKKLSHEFSRLESHIFGPFLQDWPVSSEPTSLGSFRICSGDIPEPE